MRVLQRALVASLLICLSFGFSYNAVSESVDQMPDFRTYIVREGDTLYSISVRFFGTTQRVREICNLNNLEDCNNVEPGTELLIPVSNDRLPPIRGTIRVGVGGDFRPFVFVNDENPNDVRIYGSAIQILREAFKKAGYVLDVKLYDSWSEAEQSARGARYLTLEEARRATGDQDAGDTIGVLPYIETDDRSDYLFSVPLLKTPYFSFVRPGSIPISLDVPDYNGFSFCKQDGYQNLDTTRIDRTDGVDIEVIPAASTRECFRRLVREEVDVVSEALYTGLGILRGMMENGEIEYTGAPGPVCYVGTPSLGSHLADAKLMVGPNVNGAEDFLSKDLAGAMAEMQGTVQILRDSANRAVARDFSAFQNVISKCQDSCEILEGVDCPQPPRRARLITASDYEPYVQRDLFDEGEIAERNGLAPFIVSEVLERAGYGADIDFASDFNEALEEARAATTYIGSFPWFDDPEKRQQFLYSEPFLAFPIRIYSKAQPTIRGDFVYRGLADLSNKTMCAPEGWTIVEPIKPLVEQRLVTLIRKPSAAACMAALKREEADFALFNKYSGWQSVDSARGVRRRDICIQEQPIGGVMVQNHLIVSRTEEGQQLVNDFNASLETMSETGLLRRQVDDYMARYNELLKERESSNLCQVCGKTDISRPGLRQDECR